jgi:hypothetical protein
LIIGATQDSELAFASPSMKFEDVNQQDPVPTIHFGTSVLLREKK